MWACLLLPRRNPHQQCMDCSDMEKSSCLPAYSHIIIAKHDITHDRNITVRCLPACRFGFDAHQPLAFQQAASASLPSAPSSITPQPAASLQPATLPAEGQTTQLKGALPQTLAQGQHPCAPLAAAAAGGEKQAAHQGQAAQRGQSMTQQAGLSSVANSKAFAGNAVPLHHTRAPSPLKVSRKADCRGLGFSYVA